MCNSCFVCNSPARECHFGSISQICRACSAFFRRYVLSPKTAIKCPNKKNCEISLKSSKVCRYCRMERCRRAGMKPSAVQPPRDKYSKQRDVYEISPKNSGYSTTPYHYDVESCSKDIPRLIQLHKSFKNLERVRRIVFEKQEPPKSRNMGELIEIIKIDIKLVTEFVEGSYPELHQLGKAENKLLFLHFFVKYMILEPPFLGMMSASKEMILPNGDFYSQDIGNFYTGHLDQKSQMSEQLADKLFSPYWEFYKKTIIEDVYSLKLDVYEFLALVSLVIWDTGLDGLNEKCYEMAHKMRETIVIEIQFYYKNIKKLDDPCFRLAQIMMLLTSLQKSFGKYQEELELCGFYEIYRKMDEESYQIINETLQI